MSYPQPHHTKPRGALNSFRHHPRSSSPSDTDHDLDMTSESPPGHSLGIPAQRTRYQPLRMSTLSYQNSAHRDIHDRGHSRSPRNLVVVIPPRDLPLNQGQLGNVLSMGPPHRLSQGILMPLFSSMYGQLNAIAREYNFPSTVGLCLYLHINEHGISMTPRISDDSWQYLFGHLFDGRPPSGGQQLPIGGSIEFDIDLNKARWYDAWASRTLRDPESVSLPVGTSRAPLEAHWRGESQTINADEQPVEGQWNASGSHTLVNKLRPEMPRHLPKKLSLVNRLESHGGNVPPKSQDYPDSSATHGTYASSPILRVQSAFFPVTEGDLKRRVRSWRATTELHPASMVETYQPAADVGVSTDVTTMDEYALERNFRPAVCIDELPWSVTSVGPRSLTPESPIPSSGPSSVHIDRRVCGTVPLIPTTMATSGPIDDEWRSVVSSTTQLPSPDMGERMIEDIMAPRPPAVWGNSFGWRSAMTWRQVYPHSLIQTKPTIQVQLQDTGDLMPQYPNLMIYPTADSHSDAQPPPRELVWGSSFGWEGTVTWRKVYPYSTVAVQSLAPSQLRGAGRLESRYPDFYIYPAIYPHFGIHPACEEDISKPVSVVLSGSNCLLSYYPGLIIYPAVYPHLDVYPPVFEVVKTKTSSKVDANMYPPGGVFTLYPSIVVYPAVYLHYPKASQVAETAKPKKVDVRLASAGCLTAEYPNMTIYPGTYPYLEIYPARGMRRSSGVAWGISFGWLTAKSWLQVYPLHTARSLTKRQRTDDHSSSMSGNSSPAIVDVVVRKQAVWGNSFGWKSATTWRAVWPTPYARTLPNASPISVHLKQRSDSSSINPYLAIYPAAYPHIDIHPSRVPIAKDTESQTQKSQFTVKLIPHYPNLVIYPVAYPHFDLYPSFARVFAAVENGKGESNLRRRRMEMWRAKIAAQVGLVELLANNHIWEVDEPLQLNLADYAWSQTSAGPSTPPLVLLDTPSIPGSVHIDRRIQGSVLRTPSTATTWGPQDDWYSEIISIERVSSPDLGQRALDDIDDIEFPHQPWHMVWPLFGSTNTPPSQSVSVLEYPHIVIYPPAHPHSELYPTWVNPPTTLKNQVTKTLANLSVYPVLDIYPAVYPHFNIYPAVDLRIDVPNQIVSNAQHERVQVILVALYPNFDIYPACYPYNLNCIYPFLNTTESTQILDRASRDYPWLVVYPVMYPFRIQYSGSPFEPEESPSMLPPMEGKSVDVKLPVRYPLLDIYPAGYPWSLESIYPAVTIDDDSAVLKPQYPCICIYPPVYPFVQPYPSISDSVYIPGTLDQGEYESAKACLALLELKPIYLEPTVYPHFDLYPAASVGRVVKNTDPPKRTRSITRRQRKTHMELHASVFRILEKRPARSSKTHRQLHNEVFQDGVVWTPSGYTQDLSSLVTRGHADIPARELQLRRPSHEKSTLRPSSSGPGTTATLSTDKVTFPLGQPPPLPPISPFRIRSAGVPSQPSLAVSEVPTPRVASLPSTYTHRRTTSTRLSQAVKSMMPVGRRHNSTAAAASPPPEDHKDRVKDRQSPTRFSSSVDRHATVAPPLPHTSNTTAFLTRSLRSPPPKEGLVFQRARAHERSTAANQPSSTVGAKGMHSPFVLPPLPPIPLMTEMAEVIERSKPAFA